MFSIKGLTQRLKVHTSKVAKDLTIKHRRKMFCKYDGTWYQFAANSEVIVPYKQAKEYALGHKKNLPEPININELNYDHLNGKGQEKVPVVVLLGHFNHGKTTLLDSLGGTSYVEEEKHSITQVGGYSILGLMRIYLTAVLNLPADNPNEVSEHLGNKAHHHCGHTR